METYKSSRASGVRAYEIGADAMAVKFRSGEIYVYTYTSAGRKNVEAMKKLARSGRGLATFISRNVHDRYAARLQMAAQR